MKLSLYTIVCNALNYFEDILLNVDEYARSNCKDELEFIVLDVSKESIQIGVLSRLREISKNWGEKIIIKYYPYAKDPGIYNMRLDAINHCTGDYIACVDGDDFFKKHAFEIMMNYLHEHPNYDIYEYSSVFVNNENDIINGNYDKQRGFDTLKLDKHFNLSVLEDKELTKNVYLWLHIVKSSVYKLAVSKLPRLMCTYGEDVIIQFAIYVESKSFFSIQETLHVKRQFGNNDSFGKFLHRSPELVLAFNLVNAIYHIIDSNENIFKHSDIKNSVRQSIIGLLRENDLNYILYDKRKFDINTKDLINKFESVYGKGSWKFLNKLDRTRFAPHERKLVDKYGLGI